MSKALLVLSVRAKKSEVKDAEEVRIVDRRFRLIMVLHISGHYGFHNTVNVFSHSMRCK